eukprot:GDKK01030626.1.p1 GENE.GDKK01030626.1~~GDKK01030626.1.p1  ORF type:complete len:215 (+),score=30.82 GDKK01030626.1:3-647(+)
MLAADSGGAVPQGGVHAMGSTLLALGSPSEYFNVTGNPMGHNVYEADNGGFGCHTGFMGSMDSPPIPPPLPTNPVCGHPNSSSFYYQPMSSMVNQNVQYSGHGYPQYYSEGDHHENNGYFYYYDGSQQQHQQQLQLQSHTQTFGTYYPGLSQQYYTENFPETKTGTFLNQNDIQSNLQTNTVIANDRNDLKYCTQKDFKNHRNVNLAFQGVIDS